MPHDPHVYYELPTAAFGGAALIAAVVVAGIFRWRRLTEKHGVMRSIFLIGFLVVVGGFFLWEGYRASDSPIAKVSFNNYGIGCGPWSAPWNAITDIEFQASPLPTVVQPFVRGGDSLLFKFDPSIIENLYFTEYVKKQRAVNCPIDKLDTSSEQIYSEIRAAWNFAKNQQAKPAN